MIYDTYEYKNLHTEPLQKRIEELKCSKTGNNIGIAILFMANVGSLCLIVNLIRGAMQMLKILGSSVGHFYWKWINSDCCE